MMTTSPSCRSSPNFARTAAIASGMAPRCWAIVFACATICPSAAHRAAEKSITSLTISERADPHDGIGHVVGNGIQTALDDCKRDRIDFHASGSKSITTLPICVAMHRCIAGHDNRRVKFFDHQRPCRRRVRQCRSVHYRNPDRRLAAVKGYQRVSQRRPRPAAIRS